MRTFYVEPDVQTCAVAMMQINVVLSSTLAPELETTTPQDPKSITLKVFRVPSKNRKMTPRETYYLKYYLTRNKKPEHTPTYNELLCVDRTVSRGQRAPVKSCKNNLVWPPTSSQVLLAACQNTIIIL